jgi:inosine triphosphate pyrophosphatase
VAKLLHGFEDKTGYALCVLAYTEGKGQEVHLFTGRVDGTIVAPRRGQSGTRRVVVLFLFLVLSFLYHSCSGIYFVCFLVSIAGFGWDPIFEPLESNGETFSEMSQEKKDTISHRRRAVEQFRDFLRQKQGQ